MSRHGPARMRCSRWKRGCAAAISPSYWGRLQATRARSILPPRVGSAWRRKSTARCCGWCGSMPRLISPRRGCAGRSTRQPRRRCAGIMPRRVPPAGRRSCSVRALTFPDNGFCTMTGKLSPPAGHQRPRMTQRRRIMAIWLAQLALDRWRLAEASRTFPPPLKRRGSLDAPFALIADTAHGPRIDAVNDAGRMAGVRVGMLLADARSLCPGLATTPSDPAGDLAFLEKLAIWAQRWGPWSAIDPPDGLLVDVSAVAHLFGGEQRLLADVRSAFAARNITARLAIA